MNIDLGFDIVDEKRRNIEEDRDKYIGSSDIAKVLDISPFFSRFEEMKFKAGIGEADELWDQSIADYGDVMEPRLRKFANRSRKMRTRPLCTKKEVNGVPYRINADGIDINKSKGLEIKTTSVIKEDVWDYETYLVQLIMECYINDVRYGHLVVYHRPDDYERDLMKKGQVRFERKRAQIFDIDMHDKRVELKLKEILEECEKFWLERNKLKEAYEILGIKLKQEDISPDAIVKRAKRANMLVREMNLYKRFEEESKGLKKALKTVMQEENIKRYDEGGCKLSLITQKAPTRFDTKSFKEQYPKLYKRFLIQGEPVSYVKITETREKSYE